jgi:hypothetical protein
MLQRIFRFSFSLLAVRKPQKMIAIFVVKSVGEDSPQRAKTFRRSVKRVDDRVDDVKLVSVPILGVC